MPFYKVSVNRTTVDTYVVKAEDKDKAFNRIRQGDAFRIHSNKLDGDDIAVIEVTEEDANRWFDTNRGDSVYFELTDGTWVANIYKQEMDSEHSEKWGKNEKDKR
tara:strand:+ start:46 stop:360 length:315 start_codon:yes stop_codon:yes gene_type:complete